MSKSILEIGKYLENRASALGSGGGHAKGTCWPHCSHPGHQAHGPVFVAIAPVHQLVQIESPREGIVTWETYHTYIKASGGLV